MSEVLFYQLLHRSVEHVLPMLLEKTLERGHRAVVQFGDEARMKTFDDALWSYSDTSFLPHEIKATDENSQCPIVLSLEDVNTNAAQVRFCVDVGELPTPLLEERCVFIFDGRTAENLNEARYAWKKAVSAGISVQYWQEDENGRFVQPKAK